MLLKHIVHEVLIVFPLNFDLTIRIYLLINFFNSNIIDLQLLEQQEIVSFRELRLNLLSPFSDIIQLIFRDLHFLPALNYFLVSSSILGYLVVYRWLGLFDTIEPTEMDCSLSGLHNDVVFDELTLDLNFFQYLFKGNDNFHLAWISIPITDKDELFFGNLKLAFDLSFVNALQRTLIFLQTLPTLCVQVNFIKEVVKAINDRNSIWISICIVIFPISLPKPYLINCRTFLNSYKTLL